MAVEREINLIAILEVMWERGKGILLFTFAAMILAACITLLIQDRYRAISYLVMNKSKLGERTMQNPAIPMNTYLELATTQRMLQELMAQFHLQQEPYEMKYPEDLGKRINVASMESTSLLRIEVELEDPKVAAEIANAIADNLKKQSALMMELEENTSQGKFKTQVEQIEHVVMSNKDIYEQILLKNNTQLVIHELDTVNSMLALHRQEKDNIDTALAQMSAQINEFENVFAATDFLPILVTRKNVLADNIVASTVRDKIGPKDLDTLSKITFYNEDINVAYVDLNKEFQKLKVDYQGQLHMREMKDQRIAELEKQAFELQQTLSHMQVEETLAKADFDRALEIFGGIDKQVGWAGTTVATERQDLYNIEPAVAPLKKVFPQRSLMVSLVGMIAFLLAFLYFLFRDLYGLMRFDIMKKTESAEPAQPAA